MAEEFLNAVKRRDTQRVIHFLQQGIDPNIQYNGGETALLWAAGPPSETALIEASKEGYPEIVSILLEAGADPNIQDSLNDTALMWASEKGRTEIVSLLLEAGADPNLQNIWGDKALVRASEEGHPEIVSLLLEAGADPNIQDRRGQTALQWASYKGHPEIVSLLLEAGADPDIQDNDGSTALMRASEKGHPEIVFLLLEAGADPNIQNLQRNDGKTAVDLTSNRAVRYVFKQFQAVQNYINTFSNGICPNKLVIDYFKDVIVLIYTLEDNEQLNSRIHALPNIIRMRYRQFNELNDHTIYQWIEHILYCRKLIEPI